jgi:nicotinamidase-related amidase
MFVPTARTALLPIDVQRAFDDPRWGRRNNPAMEANGLRLLAAWRQRGWPVVHVRHDSVTPGSTLHPSAPGNAFKAGYGPVGDEPVVAKSVNAAFIGTDLELRLRRLDVDSVVLFGITTDMCVSTSTRVASNLGFTSLVVGDATASFDLRDTRGAVIPAEEVARIHLATLHAEFAEVVDTDALLGRIGGLPHTAAA